MGRRRTALALAAWLSATIVWPVAALAQGSGGTLLAQNSSSPLTPFSNQAPTPTVTTTTAPVTATTASTSGGGLSGTDGVAIGIGAMLVLGGISFFIWRDARKRAPVRHRAAAAAAGGEQGPRQRPQKSRKLSQAERRRRKRGKAR